MSIIFVSFMKTYVNNTTKALKKKTTQKEITYYFWLTKNKGIKELQKGCIMYRGYKVFHTSERKENKFNFSTKVKQIFHEIPKKKISSR